MKLTTTVTHEITFSVCFFEDAEGGMNSDSFGKQVTELSEAVHILELAKAHSPGYAWLIVAEVDTKLNAKHEKGGV